jgi:branched-chain amino acid transport system substrate-binding protein
MRFMSRSLRLLAVSAIALMAFAGVSRPSAAQDEIVKIAMLGPFTGGAASIGLEQLNFAKLAVADFTAATGIKVELVEVDTELDPAKAVTGAQRVVADADIIAVIGPAGSQEVEATYPIFEEAGLAFVSPSATRPSLTENDMKTFFRVVPRDDVQGPTNAEFMVTQLGAKSVYIIDDQTSYSAGLADEVAKKLTELNVPFTRDSITQKDTDFAALVTKIKGAAPDAVFMPFQLAAQAASIARTMKEQGVNAMVFGGDGVFSVKDFITDAGGATEGAYVSNFAPDLRGVEAAKEVVAAYEAEYGPEFSSFGGPAYAAAEAVLTAISDAKDAGEVTRASVLAAVATVNVEMSVLGIPLAFDEKGDIMGASFFIFKVEGDRFVQVTMADMMAATPEATPEATPSK